MSVANNEESNQSSLIDVDYGIGHGTFSNIVNPCHKVLKNAQQMVINNKILQDYIQRLKKNRLQQSFEDEPLQPQYINQNSSNQTSLRNSFSKKSYENKALPDISHGRRSQMELHIVNMKNQVAMTTRPQHHENKENQKLRRSEKDKEMLKFQMRQTLIQNKLLKHFKSKRSPEATSRQDNNLSKKGLNESKSCNQLNIGDQTLICEHTIMNNNINSNTNNNINDSIIDPQMQSYLKAQVKEFDFNPLNINKLTGIHQKSQPSEAQRSPQIWAYQKMHQQRLFKGASLCGLAKVRCENQDFQEKPDFLEVKGSILINNVEKELQPQPKVVEQVVKEPNNHINYRIHRLSDAQVQIFDKDMIPQLASQITLVQKPQQKKIQPTRPSRRGARSNLQSRHQSEHTPDQTLQTVGTNIDQFLEKKEKKLPRLIQSVKTIDENQDSKKNNLEKPNAPFKEKFIQQVRKQQESSLKQHIKTSARVRDQSTQKDHPKKESQDQNKDLEFFNLEYFNKSPAIATRFSQLKVKQNLKQQQKGAQLQSDQTKNMGNAKGPKNDGNQYLQMYGDVMDLDEKHMNKFPSVFNKQV